MNTALNTRSPDCGSRTCAHAKKAHEERNVDAWIEKDLRAACVSTASAVTHDVEEADDVSATGKILKDLDLALDWRTKTKKQLVGYTAFVVVVENAHSSSS